MTQTLSRAPVRCMYPDEFLAVLRKHRHPRWPTIGVVASTVVNNHRQSETIFDASGTVYVANATEFRDLFIVPANCLPYTSIKTAEWDEPTARWKNGDIVRGWRTALHMLIRGTYLRPDQELSWLIGEDTYKLFPREARL